jgi:hypothetical protein
MFAARESIIQQRGMLCINGLKLTQNLSFIFYYKHFCTMFLNGLVNFQNYETVIMRS